MLREVKGTSNEGLINVKLFGNRLVATKKNPINVLLIFFLSLSCISMEVYSNFCNWFFYKYKLKLSILMKIIPLFIDPCEKYDSLNQSYLKIRAFNVYGIFSFNY